MNVCDISSSSSSLTGVGPLPRMQSKDIRNHSSAPVEYYNKLTRAFQRTIEFNQIHERKEKHTHDIAKAQMNAIQLQYQLLFTLDWIQQEKKLQKEDVKQYEILKAQQEESIAKLKECECTHDFASDRSQHLNGHIEYVDRNNHHSTPEIFDIVMTFDHSADLKTLMTLFKTRHGTNNSLSTTTTTTTTGVPTFTPHNGHSMITTMISSDTNRNEVQNTQKSLSMNISYTDEELNDLVMDTTDIHDWPWDSVHVEVPAPQPSETKKRKSRTVQSNMNDNTPTLLMTATTPPPKKPKPSPSKSKKAQDPLETILADPSYVIPTSTTTTTTSTSTTTTNTTPITLSTQQRVYSSILNVNRNYRGIRFVRQ